MEQFWNETGITCTLSHGALRTPTQQGQIEDKHNNRHCSVNWAGTKKFAPV